MLLPLFGLITSGILCALAGALVFTLDRNLTIGLGTAVGFVLGAYGAAICYALLFRLLFTDSSGNVGSTAALLGMILGLLIATVLGGWGGARMASRLHTGAR